MMLVVAMLVDMSKCYSVEAEDSQTQSLGSQTAIMYTALPGEEGDYTIRIGSDKFETSGVIMAMVPARPMAPSWQAVTQAPQPLHFSSSI